jgi:hypothetical protein
MKRVTITATAVLVVAGTGIAFTDGGQRRFREFLNGLKEAPAVVSTTGTGTFRATISNDERRIDYVLTFRDLEGDIRQGHIHIGHPQNAGGIVLWVCDTDPPVPTPSPSPSPTTPPCTQDDPLDFREGRVTGTLTADEVRDLPANGIAGPTPMTPGEFAEVVALIRAGRTYVNLHTLKFPGGEIRSQINDGHDDHGRDHDDDDD